jgi:hypothetical protein
MTEKASLEAQMKLLTKTTCIQGLVCKSVVETMKGTGRAEIIFVQVQVEEDTN